MTEVRSDRELLYLEREIRFILSRLEARNTKTVGREFGRKIARVAFIMYHRTSHLAPEFRTLVHKLRAIGPRDSREAVITFMREILDILFRLRTQISEHRTKELESEIRELQSQVDQLSADSANSEGEEESEGSLDVTSDSAIFVIMPFSKDFNDVWNGGIRKAAEDEGYRPIRVDQINRSSNITDDIIEAIKGCHVVIVDVTGNNANVMFELGYALAEKKPHIIIGQSTEFLPFDIRNIRTIEYTNSWSGIEELRSRLKEFLGDDKESSEKKRKVAKKKRSRKTTAKKRTGSRK